jgi:hypothetical protein
MTTVRTLAATALATALVGCASEERVAQMPGCHTEVIVEIGTSGFDLGGEHALRDLARETRTELTYDRWLGGRRYLLGLQTAKSSDRCDSALARLRADDRVARAELDERRSASSGWDWSSSAR